jgi:glycosyltransferase involved in cell wall biosynthesis
MRLSAPYFAEEVISYQQESFDVILCSSFVDVATFRSLLPQAMAQLPLYTYYHENQFAYPVQENDERDFHFGLTNLTTLLASDGVAFNTQHNLDTFLAGVDHILKICPDMNLTGVATQITLKTLILHPGLDFNYIDRARPQIQKSGSPVIVWNHRWEHDKNPELFFKTLFSLDEQNVDFRLIVLGQSFQRQPEIFSVAHERLQHKTIHYGFAESKDQYAELLKMGDIVVSTADHEFYGISVIEAVRAGCTPLLPNRLSYPELFPTEYLYEKGDFLSRLQYLLVNYTKLDPFITNSLTDPFSWSVLHEKYIEWLGGSEQGNNP